MTGRSQIGAMLIVVPQNFTLLIVFEKKTHELVKIQRLDYSSLQYPDTIAFVWLRKFSTC